MGEKFHSVFLRYLKELDRRFKVILVAIGAYNWASNLTMSYNQLYAIALGASPVELSSLNSVGGVVSSAISAPLGWLIDRHGVKKMLVAGLVLSAIVSAIYGFAVSWLMLIPAMILAQIGFRLVIPLADIIFVGTSKADGRAQAMGLSRVIWAIPTILAPMVAAFVITVYGGINIRGIRPLYFIQLISIISVIVFTALTLEELQTQPVVGHGGKTSSVLAFIDGFRDLFKGEKWLTEWVILMGIWRFGMSISMPFIPLWMVYAKGADQYILGAISTVGLVTSALLQVPIGMMADKMGRKKVFLLIRPLVYIGTILLVLAPSPLFLLPIGVLGSIGLMGGISDVSFIPFITKFWEAVPAEKRGRWFGLTGLFDILTVPAFLLGGFLWEAGLEELVIIIPLLIETLAVMPILIRIPDVLSEN